MDLAPFAIDGRGPTRLERPSATADVARVLADADRSGEAVVVWGGASRIGVGDTPARYDIAVDLRVCRGVVEHAPADLVCTVRAGTTIRELADALAPSRQWWPVEVAAPERATVGGTIASAAAGPSRLRHQHPRDWVIGCEAVLADGTVTRAGGRVVKNVTGYDLTRLYSGTYGTLVVLTEVTLKLLAVPESVRAFRARGSHGDLARLATRVHGARLPLDALVLDTSGPEPILVARASGAPAATGRIGELLAALGPFAETDPADVGRLHERSVHEASVVRLALPAGRELEVAEGLSPASVHVGSGFAFVYGLARAEELARLRARAEAAGGALVIERSGTALRAAAGTWGTARGSAAVALRLKERFDPKGTLAPGRM